MVRCPSTHSTPATPPLKNSLFHGCRLLDDCCVFLLNGSHQRPPPISSLYFSMGVCLAPQTGEPTALSAHSAPDPCMGISGFAMPWVGGTSDLPMEVEGEVAGVKAAAARVGCCVFCVLCCGASCFLATNDTYFIESWYQISQNGWPLHTHRQSCTK